jgi:hypothetical protein
VSGGRAQGREIPEEIVPLLEGGVATWMGTCDAAGLPEATRVRGARVGEARRTVTVFVPSAQAGVTFDNLRANPRVAVMFIDAAAYTCIQIKGEVLSTRPSTAAEQDLQAHHMRLFIAATAHMGLPAELVERHVSWPSAAVEIGVQEIFVQTPGPGAGRPWP